MRNPNYPNDRRPQLKHLSWSMARKQERKKLCEWKLHIHPLFKNEIWSSFALMLILRIQLLVTNLSNRSKFWFPVQIFAGYYAWYLQSTFIAEWVNERRGTQDTELFWASKIKMAAQPQWNSISHTHFEFCELIFVEYYACWNHICVLFSQEYCGHWVYKSTIDISLAESSRWKKMKTEMWFKYGLVLEIKLTAQFGVD